MKIPKICDALSNETRYQIIRALRNRTIETCCSKIDYYENGISVGDVVKATGLAQSTVSQHLKVLVDSGIIIKEKRGQWTCFFLNKQLIDDFINRLYHDLK